MNEYLQYEPCSGQLTWIKRPSNVVKIGDDAGCADPTRNNALKVGFLGKYHDVHRLIWFIMTGHYPTPDEVIDHEDHDPTNNAWSNLRLVKQLDNMKNLSLYRTNTTGHIGISYRKDRDTYRVRINVNGKTKTVGHRKSLEDAVALQEAAYKEHNFHVNHGKAKK